MAYTFLKAQGVATGKSRVEDEKLGVAGELEAQARHHVPLMLPLDHVVADAPREGVTSAMVTEIPAAKMGLDIGPSTVGEFVAHIKGAKTIVRNGPPWVLRAACIRHRHAQKVGEAVAMSGAMSVLGGGDTEAAVAKAPWACRFTHISTEGGATLGYLEGHELPGVQALEQ